MTRRKLRQSKFMFSGYEKNKPTGKSERKCVQKGSRESGKLREINKEIMFNFRRGRGQSNATSCAQGDFANSPDSFIKISQRNKEI